MTRRKRRSHRRRSIRRSRRGSSGPGAKIKAFFAGLIRHPVSRVVAPSIGVAAILTLVAPLPNGDGFWNRLAMIISSKGSNPIGADSSGNNIFTVLGPQLLQNAPTAALEGIGAAIVYKVGRWLGM